MIYIIVDLHLCHSEDALIQNDLWLDVAKVLLRLLHTLSTYSYIIEDSLYFHFMSIVTFNPVHSVDKWFFYEGTLWCFSALPWRQKGYVWACSLMSVTISRLAWSHSAIAKNCSLWDTWSLISTQSSPQWANYIVPSDKVCLCPLSKATAFRPLSESAPPTM